MAYNYNPKFVADFEESHDLQLVHASPVDGAAYVNIPPLNFVEVRGYLHLANPVEGRKFDEYVVVGVYPDGSITPYKVWHEGRFVP